ncbi:MAG TPA: formate dehydrogenase accessory sulfurtransferase FdhD [Bacteroidetes bacterium]|nr:formate dehydrogenase accessory sulfurtransferase FdhD [Bacteroidota bacterium]
MQPIKMTDILKVRGEKVAAQEDFLVREEPLEIRLGFEKGGVRHQKSISVTMRTPGHDGQLALGFLFTEGIINDRSQVKKIYAPPVRKKEAKGNVVVLELQAGLEMDFKKLERHFYTSSSCGVCGKTSIEAVEVQCPFEPTENEPVIKAALIHRLPAVLSKSQPVFDCTGGLHGAALFDKNGKLLATKEDIGRHNALDKLVGFSMQKNWLPLSAHMVLVSGRAGFELVQKCAVAGVPILAAVGAPSSLAVQLAEERGMTLIGFLRDGQFNVYCHPERVGFQ